MTALEFVAALLIGFGIVLIMALLVWQPAVS